MGLIPVRRSISGVGRPRIMVRFGTPVWSSAYAPTYSTSAPWTVTEALGSAVNLSSTVIPNVVNFGSAHGLVVGNRVLIAGHSVSAWNGEWTVTTRPTTQQITIDTVQGTGGGATGTGRPVPDFRRIRAGMYVQTAVTGVPDAVVIGKILTLDTTNKIITVNAWEGGQPTAGRAYTVAGWVVDCPITLSTVQTFTPRLLTHELYLGRLTSEFYGYEYECKLDWEKWLSADDLVTMREVLNFGTTDGIVLIPHIDQPGFNYNVITEDARTLSLYGRAGGHKGFSLKFKGTSLVPFPVLDGYGSYYASVYGTYF